MISSKTKDFNKKRTRTLVIGGKNKSGANIRSIYTCEPIPLSTVPKNKLKRANKTKIEKN
jgi:hypothetical protein